MKRYTALPEVAKLLENSLKKSEIPKKEKVSENLLQSIDHKNILHQGKR